MVEIMIISKSERKQLSHLRFWGEEDDHMSVASRKITHYAKSDCVGASKVRFYYTERCKFVRAVC